MLLRRALSIRATESLARRGECAPARWRPSTRLPAPRRLSTVASAKPPHASKPSKISSEESFVSKHFGKISLVVLGALGGLVYTYYLSIQDRKLVEQRIEQEGSLDPYEILQLRHMNALTREDFESVVEACQPAIHAAQPMTYRDFVALVTATLAQQGRPPVESGFLLDRLIRNVVARLQQGRPLVAAVQPSAGDAPSSGAATAAASFVDHPLPVDLLCVVLNLAMLRDAETRVAALYALGQAMEGRSPRDAAKGAPLRTATTHRLVELLQATDQLPVEKQVCETGTVWPVRTYRRKLPADLVSRPPPVADRCPSPLPLTVVVVAVVCVGGEQGPAAALGEERRRPGQRRGRPRRPGDGHVERDGRADAAAVPPGLRLGRLLPRPRRRLSGAPLRLQSVNGSRRLCKYSAKLVGVTGG